ncbi:MAG: PTS sugar transporter subunit IIC [Erysipelotrichaceae bacterium]|nr:PTS sugar transporter subunit IIC [Erysipelotrichaceae bacterium]
MDRLTEKFAWFAKAVNENKVITALKDSFVVLTPFIILASLATLFTSLICSPKTGLAGVAGFEWLAGYNSLFASISYGSLNIIALLIAYNMAYNMAKQYDVEANFGGVLGLVTYVCMVPTSIAVQGAEGVFATGLSQDVTGSMGLFYAMLISGITVYIYSKLAKIKKFEIHLPDSVPANVGKAFSSLIPTVLTVFIMCVIRFAYFSLTGNELSNLVYTVLQVPLSVIGQTPFGFLGFGFFTGLFWFFGIHGTSITGAFSKPIFLAALTKNIELVNAGQQPTEIVTKTFNVLFGGMGGFGCTLALIVAILVFGKREDEKAIAKMALPSAIFEINEPILFGLPIVMNAVYIIPFILAPILGQTIGFVATKMGLMGYTYIDVPWVMPPFINAFLATGGDWRAPVVQLVAFVAILLLYMPFVKLSNKVYEKQLADQEQGAANE